MDNNIYKMHSNTSWLATLDMACRIYKWQLNVYTLLWRTKSLYYHPCQHLTLNQNDQFHRVSTFRHKITVARYDLRYIANTTKTCGEQRLNALDIIKWSVNHQLATKALPAIPMGFGSMAAIYVMRLPSSKVGTVSISLHFRKGTESLKADWKCKVTPNIVSWDTKLYPRVTTALEPQYMWQGCPVTWL